MDRNSYITDRLHDMTEEKKVGKFLDEYFYGRGCSNTNRNDDDLELQYKGYDIAVTGRSGSEYVIDEKAAFKWRNLSTFAFEISSYNKMERLYEGWYLNSDNINDFYTLVWVNDNTGKAHKVNYDIDFSEVTSIDVTLVSKESIHEYLASEGISDRMLWDKQTEIRKALDEKKDVNYKIGRFYMAYQADKWERAINLKLPKKDLMKIGEFTAHYENNNGEWIMKIVHG